MSRADEPPSIREAQQQAWQRQRQAWQDRVQKDQRDVFRSSGTRDAWLHWEYSPEEWALFDRIDQRLIRFTFGLVKLRL